MIRRESSKNAELRRSGHILGVNTLATVLMAGAHTHVPALIILDVRKSTGISVFSFTLAQGIGNIVKGLLWCLQSGPHRQIWTDKVYTAWLVRGLHLFGRTLVLL